MRCPLAATFITFLLAILGWAAPASAQPPTQINARTFAMITGQEFFAKQTFNAVFGSSVGPFWGGGIQLVQDDKYYLEFGISRFKRDGQRAFLNGGQVFHLGIPLTATLTPFELTGGYRFRPRKLRRVRPYVGGGVGLYKYRESSDFSVTGEDIDTEHAGAIAEGGVELRLRRWVEIGADVHYTYIPGIIGNAGLSLDANEKNLGGVAGRFKFIVGR